MLLRKSYLRIGMASVFVIVALAMALFITPPAAEARDATTVCLQTSTGNPLSGGAATYYHNGGWRSLGTTGGGGCVTGDVPSGVTQFRMSYLYTEQVLTGAVGGTVTFQTTPATVRLEESDGDPLSGGTVSYYAYGNWRPLGTTGTDGLAEKEILPGSYKFRVSYLYTGAETTDPVDISGSGPDHIFTTTPATVRLESSMGADLSGGAVSYYAYGNWRTLGTTDANGLAEKEILPGSYNLRVGFRHTTATTGSPVNIATAAGAPDHTFSTVLAVVKLETCAGVGIQGGAASYYSEGNWRSVGTTDANGVASLEILPGTYDFQMSYKYVTNRQNGHTIGTDLVFKTTNVTLTFNGPVKYYAYGNWRGFSQPSMELLPGTYDFSFDGYRKSLVVSGCSIGGKVVIVNLHNDGDPLELPDHYLKCDYVGNLTNGLYFMDRDTLRCYARTGSVSGPKFSFNTADSLLTVEYATVTLKLHNNDLPLADPLYYLKIDYLGDKKHGETIHVPPGATIRYYVRTGSISGPHLSEKWDTGGDYEWPIEYATVTLDLYNGNTKLTDALYYLKIDYLGDKKHGETIHVPPGATIRYYVRTGSISGPHLSEKWDAGGVYTWPIQYATVTLDLYNGNTKLTDALYYLKIDYLGNKYHGETIHVPPKATIRYYVRTGSISGPHLSEKWDTGGDYEWPIEYATVTLDLYNGNTKLTDALYYLKIDYLGNKYHGDTIHVPPKATIRYYVRTGSISGAHLSEKWDAGGVYTWPVEYATVRFIFDLPPDVASQMYFKVDYIGNLYNGDVEHFPDDATIRYYVRGPNNWSTGHLSQKVNAGEGRLIWGLLAPHYTP